MPTTASPSPTPEQEQRAKWDLLLSDLELRSEQLRHAKAYDPVEYETRLEQLRQLKTYEPWRLIFTGMTSGAALFAAGAAFIKLIGG